MNDSLQRQQVETDPTSRFVRELRERQAMVRDTQNIYAAGSTAVGTAAGLKIEQARDFSSGFTLGANGPSG